MMAKGLILAGLTLILLSLNGCGTLAPQPNMDVAQLKAMAADKNAGVVCSKIQGPWGTGVVLSLNLDQKVISDGGVTVTPDCGLVITTQSPPPKVVPAPVPAK